MSYFIRLTQTLAARISPQAFVRLVLTISGVWLLGMYPALNWFCWDKLPISMRMRGCSSDLGSDFGQYYTGAVAARHNLWQHLYPTPNPDTFDKPPQFRPLISTKLFDPSDPRKHQGQWAFYPQIAYPRASNIAPELLAICPQLQKDWHYMYPPPLAVLLWPLGFVDTYLGATAVWFALMCASFFGTAYFSSRICRILCEKATYIEGFAALLPLIPTFLGSGMSTTLFVGNVSPFLGFLISWVAYAWLRNRQAGMSFGIVPLLLFKGIGVSWCPLLLAKPVKWKALGVLAVLTLVLNGVAFYYGGAACYRTFFVDVLPKGNIATGIGLQGMAMTTLGVDLKRWFSLLNVVLLGALYWGYWRQSQQNDNVPPPSTVISTIAGTMAVFCLCNSVVWPNYYINYLLLPFSGWILWEGFQAHGAWKKWIFGMLAFSFYSCLDALFLFKDSWLIEWLQSSGHYNAHIAQARSVLNGFAVFLLPLFESAFLLALAYRRLFFASQVMKETPVENVPPLAGVHQ